MGEYSRICVLNHEMIFKSCPEGKVGRKWRVCGRWGRQMQKAEDLGDRGHFVDTSLHNTIPKATQNLRLRRWMRRQGEDTKEGVFWKLCEEGGGAKHSVHVVTLSAVLSPQPTSLEQKSVSNITTDTGELSNERSPPEEQDASPRKQKCYGGTQGPTVSPLCLSMNS